MAKRRYKFIVTSFADLKAQYPLAVTETEIPASIEQKADYNYIAKLLDCQIDVHGIKMVKDGVAPVAEDGQEIPAFLAKK